MKGFTKGGKFRPTGKSSGLKSSQILGSSKPTGYNVKLGRTEVIKNPRTITTKNGRKAITGTGSDGTKIYRFIKG